MTEIKLPTKADWCAALRSGEYAQAKKTLSMCIYADNDDYGKGDPIGIGYCCLGVLRDLVIKADPSLASEKCDTDMLIKPTYDPHKTAAVPEKDRPPLEWAAAMGLTYDKQFNLAMHNDGGQITDPTGNKTTLEAKDFLQIADIIESDPDIK